jgi:hypothetical protein
MSPRKRKPQSESSVRISVPELLQFEFVRIDSGDAKNDWAPALLGFGLKLNRLSASSILAELSIELKDSPIVRMSGSYRAVFEVIMANASQEEIDQELQLIASNLVAPTLYPFVRETFLSTVVKAGLRPLVLPIVSFRDVFSTVELPPVAAEEEIETTETES